MSGEQSGQSPRVSFTMSYKGIVVGGMSQYHPEKMDLMITRTIDYVEGETRAETQERVKDLAQLEEVVIDAVGKSLVTKVNLIKEKFQTQIEQLR